jgi:hypothetical protein
MGMCCSKVIDKLSELTCFLWLLFVEFWSFHMDMFWSFFSKIFPKWYKNNQYVLLIVLVNSSHDEIPVGNFKFGKFTTT